MKKRFSLLLAVIFLFTASVPMFGVQAVEIQGSGSAEEPYLITSVDDLKYVADQAAAGTPLKGGYNAVYRLEDNLTLGDNEFLPAFTGQLDGNNKTITINVTNGSAEDVGLIAVLTWGSGIKNLTVEGQVTSSYLNGHTGGIVGKTEGSNTITNCVNKASVTNNAANDSEDTKVGVGGIAGYTNDVDISECVNNGTVSGTNIHTGGILGAAASSVLVEKCINTGSVTTTGDRGLVGGIAGRFQGSGCSLNLSYNTGTVTGAVGNSWVGGIAGFAGANPITTSYNSGKVENTNGNASGILGEGSATVENCFNAGEIVASNLPFSIANKAGTVQYSYNVYPGLTIYNPTAVSSAVGNYNVNSVGIVAETGTSLLSAEDMKDTSSYTGWDFDTVWTAGDAEYPYPQLQGNLVEGTIDLPEPEAPDFEEGTGTKEDPYIVKTADEFKKIAEYPGSAFKLGADIDLTNADYVPFNFTGTLDGDNHVVTVNITGTENVGLFPTVSGMVNISNLIVDGSVSGTKHVGGLIGNAGGMDSGSKIENCTNRATITATSERNGGLIGSDYDSGNNHTFTYTGLTNEGSVTGSTYVGGIIGLTRQVVTNSKNTGSVTTTGSVVGGIIGWTYGNGASNCYNTGTIEGNASVGGIIALYQGGAGSVENCYNTGSIVARSSGNTVFGGIVGEMAAAAAERTLTISNCYNIGASRNAFAFNPITTVPTPGVSRPEGQTSTLAGTIVETNCFYLSPEGEAASNGGASTPKTVAELKAGAALLGGAFEASANSYEYPQLTGLINEEASPVFYVLDIQVGANGTATPGCPVYVESGDTQVITLRPAENYVVGSVTFNEAPIIASDAGYETPAITSDSVVVITFAEYVPEVEEEIIPFPNAFTGTDKGSLAGIVFGTVRFADTNPVVEYGMLVSDNTELTLEDFVLESGSADIFTAKGEKINDAGQYGIRFIGSDIAGKTYNTRAYAKYQDGTVKYGDTLVSFTIPAE